MNKLWDAVPTLDSKAEIVEEDSDSEDDDYESTKIDKSVITSLVQEVCAEDSSDVADDIRNLSDCIGPKLKERLNSLQKSLPKLTKLPSTSVPMYTEADHKLCKKKPQQSTNSEPSKKKSKPKVFSPDSFLEVVIGNPEHSVFICLALSRR